MSRSTKRQEESGDRLGIITSVIEVLDADGEDSDILRKLRRRLSILSVSRMTSTSPASDETDFRYRYLRDYAEMTPTVRRSCGARRRASTKGCTAPWECTAPGCTCCSTPGRLGLELTLPRGGYAAFRKTLDWFRNSAIRLYDEHRTAQKRLREAECEHIGLSPIILSVFDLGALRKAELLMETQSHFYKLGILRKGHILIVTRRETGQDFRIRTLSL